MIETIGHLNNAEWNPYLYWRTCRVFENAFQELKDSGAKRIITCNTIHIKVIYWH
jgi:ribose-phosphate pyrophosphokinase